MISTTTSVHRAAAEVKIAICDQMPLVLVSADVTRDPAAGAWVQRHRFRKLDKAGGRAYLREVDGFKFDMGPTVITVPHFIEELFSITETEIIWTPRTTPMTSCHQHDAFAAASAVARRPQKYCDILPVLPFYRIYFDDGTYFDYDGDPENTRRQIAEIEPDDLAGYSGFTMMRRPSSRRAFSSRGPISGTSAQC